MMNCRQRNRSATVRSLYRLISAKYGKHPVLERAIHVRETRFRKPSQLRRHGRGPIEFHPVDRGRKIVLGDPERTRARDPFVLVAAFARRRRASHLIRVYENSPRLKRIENATEEIALGGVLQMMDRQGRNDRVVGTAERRLGVI